MSKKKRQSKSGRISQRALKKVVGGAGPFEVRPQEIRSTESDLDLKRSDGAPQGPHDEFGPEKPPEQIFTGKDIPILEVEVGKRGDLDNEDKVGPGHLRHEENGSVRATPHEKPDRLVAQAEDIIKEILKKAPETDVGPVRKQLLAASHSLTTTAPNPAKAAAAQKAIQGIIDNLQQTLENIEMAWREYIEKKLESGEKP